MRKVPKLRFKEFSDEWKEKKLGEFGKISMCKRIMKDQTTLTGDIPFYKIGTFGKKADAYIDKKLFEEYKEKYSFPKKGDILLSASGTIGRTVIYDGKPAYFQDSNIVWIATNEKIILNSFLNYLYSNIKWTTENTTIARLYNDNLANMKVNIPFYQEQEKIANFLFSVDKKISLTEEKLELFREYKKGVMQKIFSQELRFKDSNGNDYPEWEEKRLNKIADIYDGTHQTPKYVEKGIPFYSVENITNNNFINTKFVSEEDYIENNKKRKIEKNDILMTRIGSIGKSKLIDWEIVADFYVSLALIKLKDKIYPSYINQFIKSSFFQKELDKRTLKVAFPQKINLTEIGECLIKLPILKEQQKIADFLSSIDSKIESVKKELEGLREFKKGLLQQMFI
jgi:type I restriction enzyme S subunit